MASVYQFRADLRDCSVLGQNLGMAVDKGRFGEGLKGRCVLHQYFEEAVNKIRWALIQNSGEAVGKGHRSQSLSGQLSWMAVDMGRHLSLDVLDEVLPNMSFGIRNHLSMA